MESKRQQKFAGLIQEELAAIFQREGSAYLPNTLVTIGRRKSPSIRQVFPCCERAIARLMATVLFPSPAIEDAIKITVSGLVSLENRTVVRSSRSASASSERSTVDKIFGSVRSSFFRAKVEGAPGL